MEKYTPLKELPAEITCLPQEDTVCSYCGVSYLIHHEIKRLEQELRESLERLNLLEVEKSRWTKEKRDLELQLNCRAEKLETIRESLLSTTAKLQFLQNQHKELDKQRHELNSCVRELKSGKNRALQHVRELLNNVNDVRNYSHELRKLMKVKFSEIRTLLVQLSSQWLLCQKQFQQDAERFKQEIIDINRRKAMEANNHEALCHQLELTKAELSGEVHCCKQSLEKLKEILSGAELEIKFLSDEKTSLGEEAHALSEALRYQEIHCEQVKADAQMELAVVRMESDRLVQEADRKVQDLKVTAASLSLSLSERENQILELQNALASKEKEMKDCIEHRKKLYRELEKQLKATKKSYESQITELKVVCDHKVAVLDKSFAKKEQELKDSYSVAYTESQDTITKLKSSLAVAELKHKRMIESLQQELSKEKSLCDQEMMRHLQQVKELEVRISELQKEKETAVKKEAMKLEVTKQTLFHSETSCSELERKLTVAYEEISTLQAVIHKQCEERQQILKTVHK